MPLLPPAVEVCQIVDSVILMSCWNPRKIHRPHSGHVYSLDMAKSKDPILLAKDMFDEFLTKTDPTFTPKPSDTRTKAKASGSLGGLKAGKARAARLPAKKRRVIAKKAARARWSKP